MSYREDVAVVKRLTKTIERAEAEAEAAKWDRAERVWKLVHEGGYTRAKIARDVGVSGNTVGQWVTIWEANRTISPDRRLSYTEADYEAAGRGAAQRPESPEKIATRVAKEEKYGRAIVANDAARRMMKRLIKEAEARESSPTPKEAPDVPARSLDLAYSHEKDVIQYIHEDRLTPLDREELPIRAERVERAAQYIKNVARGEEAATVDWDKEMEELTGGVA